MKTWPLLALALLASGCHDDLRHDEEDLLVVTPNFAREGTIVLPDIYPYVQPGGVLLPRGAPYLSMDVWAQVHRPLRRAQLNVYLMTGPGPMDYCGQNSPDMALWTDRPEGQPMQHTVSGFRVYRLPCTVTGIRAILHSREDNGLLIPPTGAEIILDETVFARLTIRRE
jgi:hypothetical protein